MSTQITLQKNLSSVNRSNTIKSSKLLSLDSQTATFQEKIKQLEHLLTFLLPQDCHKQVFGYLEKLNQIHLAQVGLQKTKYDKSISFHIEDAGQKPQKQQIKSEKKILQTRQGFKTVNDMKIQDHVRHTSPEKRGQQKKFIKFEPKKINNKGDSPNRLGHILKTGGNL